MEGKYKLTLTASGIGYVTQAIINNLAPLLFVIFQKEFHISVGQIGFLVTYNFAVQIFVDAFSAKYAERIGYRRCIVAAHVLCVLGLAGLGFLPRILPNPYVGLMMSITLSAVGSGLIEVMGSPIVEALPVGGKSGLISLIHSFYCWGHALVVLLTTLFLFVAGENNWPVITLLWAAVPAVNAVLFAFVPIRVLSEETEAVPMKKLFSIKLFWILLVLMICSGAAEQAMAQWASYFAESGLKTSKVLGDILGPCLFAVLMATARCLYAAKSKSIPLDRFMFISGVVCVMSYGLAALSPYPIVSLVGCGICGLSVGIMWPGVISLAARSCPQGGTAMFALLALAGDVGCSTGPALVAGVSELAGGKMQAGLLAAVVFPLVLMGGIFVLNRIQSRKRG